MDAKEDSNKEEDKKEEEIFRLHTLEQMRNPAQLDTMLNVVSPKNWLFLIAIFGMFFSIIFWAIFGSIPVKIEERGL